MTRPASFGLAAVLMMVGAGCVGAGQATRPCVDVYERDRCAALAVRAAHELNVPIDSVELAIAPHPSPGQIDFGHRIFLVARLADGIARPVVVSCPGISAAFDPPCMDQPAVRREWPQPLIDMPEDATPFPEIDPATAALGKELRIPSRRINVGGVGHHTVLLGHATLPNGVLTEAGFELSDPWPDDVVFSGAIRVVATPIGGGPRFTYQWEHGWHEGVEQYDITLEYDVEWLRPGASFNLIDLVIR